MVRKTAMCWRVKDCVRGIPPGRRGVEHALKGNWAEEIFDETLPLSRSFLRKRRKDILAN